MAFNVYVSLQDLTTTYNTGIISGFCLCLNGRVLLNLEDDGSHARDVSGRLGCLGVEVAQLGDPLPLGAWLHLGGLSHQFLLCRSKREEKREKSV